MKENKSTATKAESKSSLSVDVTQTEEYTPVQRAAMLVGMFSTVRSDLNAINKAIIARETKEGYLITHEEAATASARLLRANTTMAALGRIFETALPEGSNADQIVVTARQLSSEASPQGILSKVDSTIGDLITRNRSSDHAMRTQG